MRDTALIAALQNVAVGAAPPPDMPQPVIMAIAPRSPQQTGDCVGLPSGGGALVNLSCNPDRPSSLYHGCCRWQAAARYSRSAGQRRNRERMVRSQAGGGWRFGLVDGGHDLGGAAWALLIERYEDFKGRLTRQLGSEELASESLHETWLRLHREDEIGAVQNPPAYLLRIVINVAMDRLRGEKRRAHRSEIEAALEIADSAPDPAQTVQARLELKALEQAIRGTARANPCHPRGVSAGRTDPSSDCAAVGDFQAHGRL